MWIVAMILRIGLIIVSIKMMSLSDWSFNAAPFINGIWFIIITIYFALLSIVWPKKMLCPLFNSVKKDDCCKK